jgi:anti-sigma factor RsiW
MPEQAPHVKEQTFEYLSDALEPAERSAFEAHLAGCAECRADVEQKQKFLGSVEAALTAPPAVSDLDLLIRARSKHEAQRAKAERGWGFWGWTKLAFAVVGVLLVVTAVDVIVENRPGRGDMGAPPPPEKYRYHPDAGDAGGGG